MTRLRGNYEVRLPERLRRRPPAEGWDRGALRQAPAAGQDRGTRQGALRRLPHREADVGAAGPDVPERLA